MTRPLHEIAQEIEKRWKSIKNHPEAHFWLSKMLTHPDDPSHELLGVALASEFLKKAAYWHGEDARRIKDELRQMREAYFRKLPDPKHFKGPTYSEGGSMT